MSDTTPLPDGIPFNRLGQAPVQLVDALGAKLMPSLAALTEQRTVEFLRLLFVFIGRALSITGCSVRALGLSSPRTLLQATSCCLAIVLPDQQRMMAVVDAALAELMRLPAWSQPALQVPAPDMSPIRPATRTSLSPEPSAGARSTGSTASLSEDVALEALRILAEQARRVKPWRTSHELVADDGFSPAEMRVLRQYPAYGWHCEDENREFLLRAIRSIAKHLVAWESKAVDAAIVDLRQQLLATRRTFAPTWVAGLQLALHSNDDSAARLCIAELAAVAPADAHDDLYPRLCLARSMTRTDKSESVAILAARASLPAAATTELPLRLRERISRMS
jgi:hypothetical protein